MRACPNCQEAIRAQDLDAHIAEASCIRFNPSQYNVCPLCHETTPPLDEGWKHHFSRAPGCANNPRSYMVDVDADFDEL